MMIEKWHAIKNSTFVKNVAIVASGTIAAQIITIGLSPVITRLYGPEAFGVLGVFNAMVQIIAPVAALTLPIAIVLPKREIEAKALARLSIMLSAVIAIMVLAVLFLFDEQLVRLLNLEEIGSFIFLVPFVIIFAGLLQVAEQWLIRNQQFKITARVMFLGALIVQGSIVLIGLAQPIAAVLIVMTVLGQGIKAMLMMSWTKKSPYRMSGEEKREIPKRKPLFKQYMDFPKYRAPETFLNASSQGLPVLMLSTFFGPAAAGFYAIGKTVMALPTTLIGKSVGDVFYPRVTEKVNAKEPITGLIMKATLGLGAVGIIPFGLVIFFGPELFSFVFGEEWFRAGEYARFIAIWTFFGFMNRPSVMSLPALKAQRFHLKMTIFMLIVRTGALAAGYYLFANDVLAIAFFGVSGALLNLLLIGLTLQISRAYDRDLTERH